MYETGYSFVHDRGVVWVIDWRSRTVAYGTTVAEALDQLDDSDDWLNDYPLCDDIEGWFISPGVRP